MDIQLIENDSKGAAFVKVDGKRLAEMTYSIAGPELIIIDHTQVDESLKGQSIGKKLLNKIVEKARNEGIKILPLCPFAKSMFDRNQLIQDVLN